MLVRHRWLCQLTVYTDNNVVWQMAAVQLLLSRATVAYVVYKYHSCLHFMKGFCPADWWIGCCKPVKTFGTFEIGLDIYFLVFLCLWVVWDYSYILIFLIRWQSPKDTYVLYLLSQLSFCDLRFQVYFVYFVYLYILNVYSCLYFN